MNLVTGAIGVLGPKLLDLLQHEYNLQSNLSNEVRSLSLEMEHIDAFLRKVADVPWDRLNEQVKVWAREVREASYDMEDALDIFLVHVDSREPDDESMLKRALKMIRSLFIKGKPCHDIAVVIQGIRKQLREVAERRVRYKIDDSLAKPVTPTSAIDPRLAAMYHEVGQLIGIDKSRSEVISMLSYSYRLWSGLPDDKKTKKVSIVGVGGLGKTTLAKAVYEELKVCFDCGAFVPVGRSPDLKRVFKDILLDLDKGHYTMNLNMTILDERHLIGEIREFLKDKRYFIIIDDIWELESWGIIQWALVENNCGSRIIMTTRNFEVANQSGEVYRLTPLSHDHSEQLFYTRIFGGEGKCPGAQSDEVSDRILKKCDGIPLAIITMASLLVGKPREVWSELYSDIGFGQQDNMHVENTMKILSFSYYDLPSHLRTCLLYLSAFPEDYVIEKDPLIWKWIAEGFVYKKQGNGLFELGEQYFNDLINRSMIQMVESEFDGTIEGCRVHDMVLDLIRSLSCHENFVAISDNNNAEGTLLSRNKVRRLAYQKHALEYITPQAGHMDMSLVRSYVACMCMINQWAPLLSFKLLRVLAIEHCRFKEGYSHIEDLGNLLHLRYLSLRGTNVSKLPRQIGDLKFLQTLDFYQTEIEELPASIVQLTQLVCLSCGGDLGVTMRLPVGIGKLMSLEQLTITFKNDCVDDEDLSNVRKLAKELGSLRELRVLELNFDFVDEISQRFLVESLRGLHKIQHIELVTFDYRVDADVAVWEATGSVLSQHLCRLSLDAFRFSRLPSWIDPSRFHHLSYLALSVATMDERDLKLLGRLTELRYLDLGSMKATVTVSRISASDGLFQKLRWFVMRRAMMVLLQHETTEDWTFSFHIWNGIDPMPFFGYTRRNSCCCVPSGVMPNLQVLETCVFVRALNDANDGDCGIIGFNYLTSLQKVKVSIQCKGAYDAGVEALVSQLRFATKVHPNRPTLEIMYKWCKGKMASSSVKDQESKDESLPTEAKQDHHGKDKEYEEKDNEDHDKYENKDENNNKDNEKEEGEGTSMKRRRTMTRPLGLVPPDS